MTLYFTIPLKITLYQHLLHSHGIRREIKAEKVKSLGNQEVF